MANTRSQSRRASSVQPPQALSSETKPETETEASIKLEPVPPHRLGSPSLLRATPQVQPQSKVKVEPSSPINSYISPAAHTSPESNSDTDTVSDSESQPQVKVEVVSDYDEDEDEARDEVPELSHFAALRLADVPRSKSKGPGSVMSTEDAQSTIDSFLVCRAGFTSKPDNKLRLWQSLCIELGLVALPDEEPVATLSDSDSDSVNALPPVPATLTQARLLLSGKVYVNLTDYLEARKVPVPRGQRRDLSHLLHRSNWALIKYTHKTGKFTPKKLAKHEWLKPLMRDMSLPGR